MLAASELDREPRAEVHVVGVDALSRPHPDGDVLGLGADVNTAKDAHVLE
jgi:hypothetical protein